MAYLAIDRQTAKPQAIETDPLPTVISRSGLRVAGEATPAHLHHRQVFGRGASVPNFPYGNLPFFNHFLS